MSLIKCPECGKEVSDTIKICPHCGYRIKKYNTKIRKGKNILIFILIGIIFIFVAILGIGKGSLNNALCIIKSGSFQCVISHDLGEATCEHGQICKRCGSEIGEVTNHKWSIATCQHGKICEYCNLEEGEKTDHIWIEATCNTPKMCKVCKIEEGSILGHSCRLGYCTNCGEYITELLEVYNKIREHMHNVSDLLDESMGYLGKAREYNNSSTSNIIEANNVNSKICDEFENAIKACGDYPEFSKVRVYLMQAKGYIYVFDTIEDGEIAAYAYLIKILEGIGESANSMTEAYYELAQYEQ